MTLSLTLYRLVTVGLRPLVSLYLSRRLALGKEEPARFRERFGQPSEQRVPGPLVWIHAASVGEATSMLALIDRLLEERPRLRVLVTTGTVTSARLLAERLPKARTCHQYVPLDRPAYVRRFLDHWRPDLGLWVESELWPNLISESHARGVPLLLLNGRMSERSFRGWQRLPKLAACLLASFDLCLAQDPVQAQRLAALGAPHVASVGDLKAAAPPLPVDKEALQRLRITVRGRPLWLAASTHAGEEDAAAEAHQILAPIRPDLLTIIAPRHPQRANEIVATLRARGLNVARRSRGETLCADTHIYLADTLGELGLFYRLTGIAFIGGSLRAHGGHNPLEAALLDCAILHGPDMSNCAAIAQALHDAGAARAVADARELGAAVAGLLDDPGQREARAAAAAAVAARHRAVLDAAMERLCPWLDPMAARVEPVSA